MNMHADANPPTGFTMGLWNRLRNDLFAKGKVSMPNGTTASDGVNKDTHEHRAWSIAKHMNLMQREYSRSFCMIGIQGRLIAEDALTILGVPSAQHVDLNKRLRAYELGTPAHVSAIYKGCNQQVKDNLHLLRTISNKGTHADSLPFLPTDKPLVANAAYSIALYVLHNATWRGRRHAPHVATDNNHAGMNAKDAHGLHMERRHYHHPEKHPMGTPFAVGKSQERHHHTVKQHTKWPPHQAKHEQHQRGQKHQGCHQHPVRHPKRVDRMGGKKHPYNHRVKQHHNGRPYHAKDAVKMDYHSVGRRCLEQDHLLAELFDQAGCEAKPCYNDPLCTHPFCRYSHPLRDVENWFCS